MAPGVKRKSKKRGAGAGGDRVVTTRANWVTRAVALAIALHALFLISPWFDYGNVSASGRIRWYDGYLQSFGGRLVLCAAELALATLLWKRSTRRESGVGGRWYHRWPWG